MQSPERTPCSRRYESQSCCLRGPNTGRSRNRPMKNPQTISFPARRSLFYERLITAVKSKTGFVLFIILFPLLPSCLSTRNHLHAGHTPQYYLTCITAYSCARNVANRVSCRLQHFYIQPIWLHGIKGGGQANCGLPHCAAIPALHASIEPPAVFNYAVAAKLNVGW